jgi:CTP:molybdopterin cytidylyltransferase MocA
VNASVAAIVLAAGASRRLGQPKQLLMHGGETLLGRAIRLANEAGAAPTLTVLGANREVIHASIDLSSISIPVINDQWEKGISTSIHAGLKALDKAAPNAQGVLILSCDQPRLPADHLRTLIQTFVVQLEPSIVASAYMGVNGIPAVFPRMTFPHLLALRGDRGARAMLVEPPCPLIAIPFPGGEVDIDRPEDLEQLE